MRIILIVIGFLLFNFFGFCAYAQEDEFIERPDIVWLNPVILGSLTHDYHFMLEVDSTYNDVDPILQGTTVRPAIIFQHDEHISYWLGYAFLADLPQRERDPTEYENRIWEQILMSVYKSDSYSIFSRTRLEQREDPITPQWSVRFREQISISFLEIFSSPTYAPYLIDEILLNFNNPEFVGQRFVDENRVYVGIQFNINQATTVNIAYTNQVQFGMPKNRMNHILNVQLTLNVGAVPSFFLWGAAGI